MAISVGVVVVSIFRRLTAFQLLFFRMAAAPTRFKCTVLHFRVFGVLQCFYRNAWTSQPTHALESTRRRRRRRRRIIIANRIHLPHLLCIRMQGNAMRCNASKAKHANTRSSNSNSHQFQLPILGPFIINSSTSRCTHADWWLQMYICIYTMYVVLLYIYVLTAEIMCVRTHLGETDRCTGLAKPVSAVKFAYFLYCNRNLS